MPTVTLLIGRLKSGSRSALAALGGRFHAFRVGRAGRLLGRGYPGLCQPDDVANLVLHRLWQEVKSGGRVRDALTDTRSLLAVLDLLTRQRVQKVRVFDRRAKRDAARTVRTTAWPVPARPDHTTAVELPTGLTDRQRRVAELLFAGWLQEELPPLLGCSLSTVYRDVKVIRAAVAAADGR